MTSNKSVCEDHVSGLNQKPPESPLLGVTARSICNAAEAGVGQSS